MKTAGTILVLCAAALLISFSPRVQHRTFQYKSIYDTAFAAGDIIHFTPVRFELGKCPVLNDTALNDSLRKVAQFINDHPAFVVHVRTHSDTVYQNRSTKLTQCRAEAVVQRLILLGADRTRIVARGMGESEPLGLEYALHLPSGDSLQAGAVLTHRFIAARKSNKADWEYMRMQNRRTDLKIIRTDYTPLADTSKH
jgi:outer membrane protein OmpA-like peptidoglycan-associated protein